MRYPRQQAEIVGLVDNIINGVSEHPDLFPINDPAALQAAREEFMQASEVVTDTKAQFLQAAALKQDKLNKLQQVMKNQVKLGTVANADSPENLSLIGWGAKRAPQQIEIPGQPTNLKIIAQTDDTLFLNWDKPSQKTGGPVRSYTIERKQFNGDWSQWQLAGTSYNNDIKLTKQPIGIKLEYQVRAGNASGQSFPSNTVSVVL
jgi:hypothetical protein